MQIREPKFIFGDKVYCKQYKSSAIITGVSDYSFNTDKYFYNVEWEQDDYLDEIHEDLLEPYIEKPKTVWDLEEREECYSLTICGNVHHGFWDGSSSSIAIRDTGGIFLTKEEAEFEIERRKIETEMLRLGGRRKFNRGKDNYYITYDYIVKDLVYLNRNWVHDQGGIYFDTDIYAIDVVQEIGEDKIKKYIFGVE